MTAPLPIYLDQLSATHDNVSSTTINLQEVGSGCFEAVEDFIHMSPNVYSFINIGKLRSTELYPTINTSTQEYYKSNFVFANGIPMASGHMLDGRSSLVFEGVNTTTDYYISVLVGNGPINDLVSLAEKSELLCRDQGCGYSIITTYRS